MLVAGRLDRRETLFLWVSLLVLLALARAAARAFSLRVTPPERCLFIGDADGSGVHRQEVEERRGVRAELVGHIERDTIDAWSSDARSPAKLARCARSLAA